MKEIKNFSQVLTPNRGLTIVIGSGVNIHAIGKKQTILTSWPKLLDAVFEKKSKVSSENYILDYERRLVERTSVQNEKEANEIQNGILKNLCELIEEEQSNKKYTLKYPTYLFKKEIVANVISLNLDLIPERIMSGGKIPKLGKQKDSLSNYKSSNVCRYREIDGIRYWHPHGDIKSKDSLVLGMTQYIKNVKHLDHMRRHHKGAERSEKGNVRIANSWYEALVNHPVLVLGASLSDNELDIWGALINRERNFAKGVNRNEHRPPVFIMWSECESGKFNKPDWVEPIFPVNLRYEQQWLKLENLFGGYKL